MVSPTSCVRCSKPAAVLSPAGLCPECAATADTAERTRVAPRAAPTPAVPTLTPLPPGSTASGTARGVPVPHAPAGYELLDHLGSGGMGAVYLAREQATERLVAMKFLRHPADPDAAARFLVELQVLAALDHPNIVRVLTPDLLRAEPFFTMEHMPGGSLARALDPKTPVPIAEAVQIVRAVAGAVAAAHEQGVIHRDLKPSNILLAADGTPKVADFGLAKRLARDESLTTTGAALGTPSYMPPEQISRKNGEIGTWSDVYGLGATLYHLLVGRAPFVGDTSQEIVEQVLADPPQRLRALRLEIPQELEGIVLKCLEKDPRDRYQTAAELAADLDRFTEKKWDEIVAPPLTRWRRAKQWAGRHRARLAVGAVGLVALAALVTVALYWPWDRQDPEAAFLAQARKTLAKGNQVTLIGQTGSPVYSRWRIGPGETRTLKDQDGVFAIVARGYGFLELFPDPGIDRYTLSAEIQHVEAAGAINVPPRPALHTGGVYVAHAQHPVGDDNRIHTFGVVEFSDFLPKEVAHTQLFYRDLILYERRLRPTIAEPFPVGYAKRDAAGFPGPWRPFDIVVTPEGVSVSNSGQRFAGQDAAGLRTRSDNFQAWAAKNAPDVRLDGWSSRRPVGVWVYGSCVAVRNVKITPLPP